MGKKKIIIVEDDELNMKLFNDLLTVKGLEVFAIKEYQDFIGQVKQIQPNLILMDIQLHNISGLDLIKTVKQDEETQSIPIIAVTAFAMKADEERIMKSGCEAYISKPVGIDNFFHLIDNFTRN